MERPEKRIRIGACTASIFVNGSPDSGRVPFRTVVLQRVYKDKDGAFKYASSFTANDVPRAVLALVKAYEFMTADAAQHGGNQAAGGEAAPRR